MLPNVLPAVALTCLGLYAGSLLTEAVVLVPMWRRMPAVELYRLHPELGPRLFRYFAPITTLGVAMPTVQLVLHLLGGARPLCAQWASVALCLCALAIYFAYFQRANRRIASQSLSAEDLGSELAKWARFHWARTVAVLLAFALLIFAHS